MAMNANMLGAALAKVVADKATVTPTAGMITDMQVFWTAIAAEIIKHIQQNAQISTPNGAGNIS